MQLKNCTSDLNFGFFLYFKVILHNYFTVLRDNPFNLSKRDY